MDKYYASLKLKKTHYILMSKKRYTPYSFGMIFLLMISWSAPIFAEVTNFQIDSKTSINNQIGFFGTVEKESNGLITIVIRDFNDDFIMLTQAQINPDYSFKKIIDMKNNFSEPGMYNATGFILNMTKGVMVNFKVTTNGIHVDIIEKTNEVILIESIEKSDEEVPVKLAKEIDFHEIKFLSKDTQFNAGICVFGNRIAIFSYEHDLSATILEGKAISGIIKSMFFLIWDEMK